MFLSVNIPMKILFSPSESKNKYSYSEPINIKSFMFEDAFSVRMKAVSMYNDFIKSASVSELQYLFGIKDKKEIDDLRNDIMSLSTCPAVERYSGVSYSFLKYGCLDETAKNYLLNNTVIFSNLFGPVSAGDKLPYYKLKQGAKIGSFDLEKYYKEEFSALLDNFLCNEAVIDLRAGFYEKFYTLKQPFSTYKFLKGGKILSHYAKAYRGILLNIIAGRNIESNEELLRCLPENLEVEEIKIMGFKEEITLSIKD